MPEVTNCHRQDRRGADALDRGESRLDFPLRGALRNSQSLERAGYRYRPYSNEALPGIEASYGMAAHDPSFVQRVWSQIMPVLTTRVRAIDAMQDLNVLTKV